MRTQTMVRLTEELVQRLDQRALRLEKSRPQLIREVLEAHLDRDEERERVNRFIDVYTQVPETDEELATAHAAAAALVREEPWDP